MDSVHTAVVHRQQAEIDVNAVQDFVLDDRFGGYTSFVGRVRKVNHGKDVTGISYDIFEPLALNHFAKVAADLQAEFGPLIRIAIEHATGRLNVGDVAVAIAVGTVHRDEAFRACRTAIERVKHESPIWKQEHFADGDSEWSEGCSLCGHD